MIQSLYSGNIHTNQVIELASILGTSKYNIQRILKQLIKMDVVKHPTENWYHISSWRNRPNVITNPITNKPLKNYVFDVDINQLIQKDGLKYLRAIYWTYCHKVAIKYSKRNQKTKPLDTLKIKTTYPHIDKTRLRTFAEVSSSFVKSVLDLDKSLTTIARGAKLAAKYGLLTILPNFSYFRTKCKDGILRPIFYDSLSQAQAVLLHIHRTSQVCYSEHYVTRKSLNIKTNSINYSIVKYESNYISII